MPPDGLPTHRHQETVMGTVVSIAVYGEVGGGAFDAAIERACAHLHHVDDVFSTWKPGSVLSRYRRGELGSGALPAAVVEVLERCRDLRERSGGWFDPWSMPGGFDPTGMVKGWAAERAADLVAECGAAGVIVNAGGDIALRGRPAPRPTWRLGIRHPWQPTDLAGLVTPPGALATSGLYERGLHLLDPFTGERPSRVASASVTGPDLATADALATAAAVAGMPFLDVVAGIGGYECYLIGWDGRGGVTPGFPWATPVLDSAET
jgi:thiamine biosynthesis lipoprotein